MIGFILANMQAIGVSLTVIVLLFLFIYFFRKIKEPNAKVYKIQDYSIEIDIKAMKEEELINALMGKVEKVTPSMAREKLKEKFHYTNEQIVKVIGEQEKGKTT